MKTCAILKNDEFTACKITVNNQKLSQKTRHVLNQEFSFATAMILKSMQMFMYFFKRIDVQPKKFHFNFMQLHSSDSLFQEIANLKWIASRPKNESDTFLPINLCCCKYISYSFSLHRFHHSENYFISSLQFRRFVSGYLVSDAICSPDFLNTI